MDNSVDDDVSVNVELSKNREKPSTSAFNSFGDYMDSKIQKLNAQFGEHDGSSSTYSTQLASHDREYVIEGTPIFLQESAFSSLATLYLLSRNGGKFCHYYTRQEVTHVIASNLSASRSKDLQNNLVIKPEWITASLKAGKLLPVSNFKLNHRFGTTQVNSPMKEFLSPKPSNPNPGIQTTSTSPDFLSKFYSSSRLHHLSAWKSELQKYSFRENPVVTNDQRIIIHVDMDCFFASVALRDRPDLRQQPVGISHGQGQAGMKSSDVASCNYIARSKGVKNGMNVGKAKELCPEIIILPYEFEKYKDATNDLYEILVDCADALEAVSCDEAFLDVSNRASLRQSQDINTRIDSSDQSLEKSEKPCSPIEHAKYIVSRIRERTGLDASVGIGRNPLIARIATKLAKPTGIYFLDGSNVQTEIDKLTVDSLPGVGWSLRTKIGEKVKEKQSDDLMMIDIDENENEDEESEKRNSKKVSCGLVRQVLSLQELQDLLGTKTGISIWNGLHGTEERIIASESVVNFKRQSISVEVNWGVRFETMQQTNAFLSNLWKELLARLKGVPNNPEPKKITVNIGFRHPEAPMVNPYKYLGCGHCERFSKSLKVQRFVEDEILEHFVSLFWKLCEDTMKARYMDLPSKERQSAIIGDLRGIGFQFSDLEYKQTNKQQRQEEVDSPLKLQKRRNNINYKKLEEAMNEQRRKQRNIRDVYLAEESNHEWEQIISNGNPDEILNSLILQVDQHNLKWVQDTILKLEKSGALQEVSRIVRDYMNQAIKW